MLATISVVLEMRAEAIAAIETEEHLHAWPDVVPDNDATVKPDDDAPEPDHAPEPRAAPAHAPGPVLTGVRRACPCSSGVALTSGPATTAQ
eukprot:12094850-Alexandrium_andersonii.AAC.1